METSTHSDIFLRAALLRGYFINNTSRIEKLIEQFIAHYFCQNEEKVIEMIEFLTGDRFVSFESKRMAFELIVKKHFDSMYKANSSNFAKLTTIQNQRNKLAHLVVSTNKEAREKFEKDKTIGFAKFSGKSTIIWYTPAEYENLLDVVDEIYIWLSDIIHSL